MAAVTITPSLGSKSFSCPHCGAMAHQTWYQLYVVGYTDDTSPWMPEPGIIDTINRDSPGGGGDSLRKYFNTRLSRKPFLNQRDNYINSKQALDNVFVSECYSCDQYSIWVADELIYPNIKYSISPTTEMPDNVKTDFLEAAAIVDISARGAAALLRLCIQKVAISLGGKGDNLNTDIGKLIEDRIITQQIQQALDVVRVVGNNAVHPGTIDFQDNKNIAMQLFSLVNVIVETSIAAPKHIKTIYESVVPEGARAAIEKRDASKLPPNQK
jgi:Domain of unknown function (DUF4145)